MNKSIIPNGRGVTLTPRQVLALGAVAASGEGAELVVNRGAGEPVGERRHDEGADAEDDLERVALGVTVPEEGAQGRLADVARGVEYPQRELPERVQPRVGQRLIAA